MAKKTRTSKHSIELTVERLQGSKKPAIVDQINKALDEVPTQMLENAETIAVKSVQSGPTAPPKPPTPPKPPKEQEG